MQYIGEMRQSFVIGLVIVLISCEGKSVDERTPLEIAQELNGYWKLKSVKTPDGVKVFDLNTREVKCFDFDGTKGVDADLTENADGSFQTRSHDPFCEVKAQGDKRIIEYFLLFNDSWHLEIKSLSEDELVLADSITTWTYVRHEMKLKKF